MMTTQTNVQRRFFSVLATATATIGIALATSGIANAETPPPTPNSTTSDAGVTVSGAMKPVNFFGDFLKYKLVSVCILDPGKGRVCEKVLVPK
jgi:hypothetical protein